MMAFELLEPGSLKEAIALIDPDDPEVRPIAGGTALMLMMKAGYSGPGVWSACANWGMHSAALRPRRRAN